MYGQIHYVNATATTAEDMLLYEDTVFVVCRLYLATVNQHKLL